MAARDKPFARVHAIVKRVPRGRVATYGQISQMIDGRLTPLAVGWAIRAASDEIPWHRIINSRGTVSTDKENPGALLATLGDRRRFARRGSLALPPGLQRAMLESEGIQFDRQGRIDLARFRWRPRR